MTLHEASKTAWLETDTTVYGDDPLLEVVWTIEDLTHDEAIREQLHRHLERVKQFREAFSVEPTLNKNG